MVYLKNGDGFSTAEEVLESHRGEVTEVGRQAELLQEDQYGSDTEERLTKEASPEVTVT